MIIITRNLLLSPALPSSFLFSSRQGTHTAACVVVVSTAAPVVVHTHKGKV